MSDNKDDTQDPNLPDQASGGSVEDDWAAAMAEQQSAHDQPTQASGLGAEDDWAAALAEQTAATSASAAQPAAAQVFQPLSGQAADGDSDIDMIMDIPVQLSVELGRTRLTIKNILQLGQGSVVELDGLAGEPMDIYVNGYLIAQGEVVVVDEKYGIRVTDIITPSDRIARLNNRR
ncbi:flagellar motor switch protein FliN [Castellaniella daejeonensis]|jgi:flagellar motor switch protein FliN/FliY|uniref:Flagellar motor switch protein FliN n=1 Tax=Castellaniella daejeonensis TaxID=659013 RepID=A0ABN0THH0_9BURK|nr:flagellar motor switch protein FliN [Castellaniella sp.]HET8702815.1 flagellar motor switch protein FliN [Castellaniella sp.]